MTRIPLSAVIITLDAAKVLSPCLASLDFVDEILVVDSGSSDQTLDLARQAGARILHQPWLGFGPQKQFAVSQAQHPWVLCLDADERISPELKQSILATLRATPKHQAFRMARRNRFMGRWLSHGEGYPDPNLRLYHRDHGMWSQDPIHEHVLATGTVGWLHGDLLHESAPSLDEYLAKQNRYTTLQAHRLVERGYHPRLRHLLLNPVLRFIKFYLLRLGCLDGLPGLVHVLIGCGNSFTKYAKAMALLREARSPASADK
ncbi:MAG: glycosyltransferase family 2 protein [Magnetococcales bacterium]|nr:glycosyltransferase family 2 protein [Magnetococcales bacterium]